MKRKLHKKCGVFEACKKVTDFFDTLRGLGLYLLLRSHFVFYDYFEPVIFFLIDYLSVMALFVLIGCYFIQGLKRLAWLEAIFLNADKE